MPPQTGGGSASFLRDRDTPSIARGRSSAPRFPERRICTGTSYRQVVYAIRRGSRQALSQALFRVPRRCTQPRPAPSSAVPVVITVREFLTVPPGRPRPRLRSFQHSSPSPSIGSCPPIACLGPRTPLLAVERSSLRGLWKGPPGGPCDADAGSDSEHSKIPKIPNIPKVDCPARQARCPLRTFDVPETAPTHLRTPLPAARRPSSSLRRWKRRRMTRRESRCLSDPN